MFVSTFKSKLLYTKNKSNKKSEEMKYIVQGDQKIGAM